MQTLWELTAYGTGIVRDGRILICDRDPKWSRGVEQLLTMAGTRMVRTPACAPNCNAYAERFVRSIKDECLNRIVPLGEPHLLRALAEYVAHYHGERNHQGLGNELIDRSPSQQTRGPVRRRQRMGGILSHYYRSAASPCRSFEFRDKTGDRSVRHSSDLPLITNNGKHSEALRITALGRARSKTLRFRRPPLPASAVNHV